MIVLTAALPVLGIIFTSWQSLVGADTPTGSIRLHSLLESPELIVAVESPASYEHIDVLQSLHAPDGPIRIGPQALEEEDHIFAVDQDDEKAESEKKEIQLHAYEVEGKQNMDEECSRPAETSKKPRQGLLDKTLANERVVSEGPYGWVYPPEAEETRPMKTLHLDIRSQQGAGTTEDIRGLRNLLRDVLGSPVFFLTRKRQLRDDPREKVPPAVLQHSGVPDASKNFLQTTSNTGVTVNSDPHPSALAKTEPVSFLSRALRALENPIARAAHAVEDWWNGGEAPPQPTSGTGGGTSPYGLPTPASQQPYGQPSVPGSQPGVVAPRAASPAAPGVVVQPLHPAGQQPYSAPTVATPLGSPQSGALGTVATTPQAVAAIPQPGAPTQQLGASPPPAWTPPH